MTRNGGTVGDFTRVEELLGRLARAIDDVNKSFPGGKDCNEAIAALNRCLESVEKWRDRKTCQQTSKQPDQPAPEGWF